MKIRLYELKHLVAQIINEGKVADDLKELQRLHPREADSLSDTPFFDPRGQPTKWFNWLKARFITKRIKEEFALAFDHVIDTTQRYAQNERALSDALRQQAFKEALVAALPGDFNLNKIKDISQLNIREMDSILDVLSEYNENKKDLLGIDYDAIDIEGDRLAKIGPWNIWMPTTRETSCTIVRVRDPRTGKMKKSPCDWCTIRTDKSNLFYGYTARHDADIILYYLIRDNPEINKKENEDFISIGFLNGVPDMTGTTGGITVRCNNTGLKEGDLKRIFGANYTSIINLLTQKTKEVGGQHPAKTKLVAATQSLEGLNYFMKGISHRERAELAAQVLSYGKRSENIDPDVENDCCEYAAASNDDQILKFVASNRNCPPHILENLSQKMDGLYTNVRIAVAENHNCPPRVLEKLFFNDEDSCWSAWKNPNFPEDIKNNWELLSDHNNMSIKTYVADSPKCPPHILEKLFNGDDAYLSWVAFRNPNFPPDIKTNWELLSDHNNWKVREWVAYDLRCPPNILKKIFNNERNNEISWIAFNNPSFPEYVKNNWEFLINQKNLKVREWVAKHHKCPPEISIKISLWGNEEDPNGDVRNALFSKLILPSEALENLVNNSEQDETKIKGINHINCPPRLLKKLSKDPSPYVSSVALRVMKKRGIQLESLRRKISKLIYAVR